MIAKFSGSITAEKSCDNVTSLIKLKSNETGTFVSQVTPTLTKVDNYTYNFTSEVEGPNEYGYY